jgi:hypothetical protein
MPKSLTEFANDAERDAFRERNATARDNRVLRAELKDATERLKRAEKLLGIVERIDAENVTPQTWDVPARSAQHRGVPCLELTDLHYGAVIRPEEINNINAYNLRIANQRIKRTFEGTIKLARDYFANIKYDGIQVFLPGDNFSGEIHDELRETNEASIADAIVGLLEPIESGLRLLAREFGKVKVACVVGNHGRRTHKPKSKGRVADNYDYLLYRLLARDFAADPAVDIHVSPSADTLVKVYRTRYLLTHGDQFKGGSGISAELAPLLLGVHRKKRRDAAVGKPFDIMVMGHFHRTLMLPQSGIIVGGSIMGYDEYAFMQNFLPEPPMSAFWLTTPERGVTFTAPVHAVKRSEEGW